MIYHQKPAINHIRRFGCRVYKRIPESQRDDKKLGHRSRPCVMLGYVHNATTMWKVYDFENGKVTNVSDAIFDEKVNAYASCEYIGNKDILGMPEPEPLYEEIENEEITPQISNPDMISDLDKS